MLENRKVLTAVIGYIIGIIMGLYCKISIVLFYVIIYLIYLIFIQEKENKKFKLFSFKRYFRYVKIVFNKKAVRIIIIFSIISNTTVLFQNYKYENLYKNLDEQNCEFKGIVISNKKDKCKVKIINEKYRNTYLYIILKENTNIEYGDEIIFNGEFWSPQKRSNYKGFDYSNYLKTLKIYGTVNVENIKVIEKNKGNIIFKYTNKLSTKIKEKIEKSSFSNDEKAILEGILLGDKTNISEETLNDFSESNISYILAVSGIHISYIILASNFILTKLIGKHYAKPLTSVIVFIYMCIVNFTPSVVRAGITGIVLVMSNFFYRKNDVWESLGLALFIILVYNPFLINDIGFKLSFSGTIGIVVFQKTFKKWIRDKIDRINRKAIRKNKRILKFSIKLVNSKIGELIQDAIVITISATLTVMPVVLVSFNKINVSSLLISILISFVIGPIVILGLVFIILKASVVEEILTIFLRILTVIAKIGSRLPLNQIYFVTPNILQIIIYYIFIFIFNIMVNINLEKNQSLFQIRIKNIVSFIKFKIKSNRKKFTSILLIINLLWCFILNFPKDLKIYFVDVGQGDCTLIMTPRNKSILIDGGGSDRSEFNVR